jgi:ABC-type multidrug transport system permease subunit
VNQQTGKFLLSGIGAGVLAAVIEIIISAAITSYLGKPIDVVSLIWSGAGVGLITVILTVIISALIARRKQKA